MKNVFASLTSFLKAKAILVPVIIWLVILGGFVFSLATILLTGQQVTLLAQPVDPIDIFRGNYVALHYPELSNISQDSFASDLEFPKRGDQVYVSLDVNAVPVTATSVSKQRPQNGIFLQGRIENLSEQNSDSLLDDQSLPAGLVASDSAEIDGAFPESEHRLADQWEDNFEGNMDDREVPEPTFITVLEISYGIESYFVSPERAQVLERQLADGVAMAIKIHSSGKAVIVGVVAE